VQASEHDPKRAKIVERLCDHILLEHRLARLWARGGVRLHRPWLEVRAFMLAFELFSGPVTSLKQFGGGLVFSKFLIAQLPVLP